jgi:hypothetical protein
MTSKPLFINIVAYHLYIIGGNELYLVSLPNCSVKTNYPLGSDLIHAAEPGHCLSFPDQPGLCVYLWN